jgi:hypothetical protein
MKCINLFRTIKERKQKKEVEKKRKLELQRAQYSKDPELLEMARKLVYVSSTRDVQCIPFTYTQQYSDSKDLSQNGGYYMYVSKKWTETTRGINIYVDDVFTKRHVISTEEHVIYQDADYE